MKKHLLAALLVVGAMSYAGEKVIIPVDPNGEAKATLPVEVNGTVFAASDLSLVVEIDSQANASNDGFAIKMGDLFDTDTTSSVNTGDFKVYVQKAGVNHDLKGLTVQLHQVSNGTAITGTHTVNLPQVTLAYELSTVNTTAKVHTGKIKVEAKAKGAGNVGVYNDKSVELRVGVTGQN